jgi:hypothetical protein
MTEDTRPCRMKGPWRAWVRSTQVFPDTGAWGLDAPVKPGQNLFEKPYRIS